MDWKKLGWKALKTAGVAGVAVVVVDPSLTPALLELVPAEYRVWAVILIPTVLTALRNWIKHAEPATSRGF